MRRDRVKFYSNKGDMSVYTSYETGSKLTFTNIKSRSFGIGYYRVGEINESKVRGKTRDRCSVGINS